MRTTAMRQRLESEAELRLLSLQRAWWRVWLILAMTTALLCSCPQLKEWRDNQIQTSHNLAATPQRVQPPAQPVQLPSDVEAAMPRDPSFAVLSYTQIGDTHHVSVLSEWDTQQTAEWLLVEMSNRGYNLTDNSSRILEGADFYNQQARLDPVNIKVELNQAGQAMITYIFTES